MRNEACRKLRGASQASPTSRSRSEKQGILQGRGDMNKPIRAPALIPGAPFTIFFPSGGVSEWLRNRS